MRDEIIARLEKATGPDRELDHDICLLCGPHRAPDWYKHKTQPQLLEHGPSNDWVASPRYTFSIDAALTLVPPESNWGVQFEDEGDEGDWFTAGVDEQIADGRTPAIALCIAALKATAPTSA